MNFQFKISFEDYYEYNKIYSKMSIGKTLQTVFNLGVSELAVGALVILLCILKVLANPVTYLLAALLLAVGVYMVLYSKVIFYNRMKKEVRFKHEHNDYFQHVRNIEITDENILAYSDHDDYRANFREDIKEFIETENLFMIMVHGRRGIIIPKKAVDKVLLRRELKNIAQNFDIGYRYIKG